MKAPAAEGVCDECIDRYGVCCTREQVIIRVKELIDFGLDVITRC